MVDPTLVDAGPFQLWETSRFLCRNTKWGARQCAVRTTVLRTGSSPGAAASTGEHLSHERAWSQAQSSHGDDKDLLVGGPEGRKWDQGSGMTMLKVNWNGKIPSPCQSRVLTMAAKPAPIIGSRSIEIGQVWPVPMLQVARGAACAEPVCRGSGCALTCCLQIRMKAGFLLVMKFIDELNA